MISTIVATSQGAQRSSQAGVSCGSRIASATGISGTSAAAARFASTVFNTTTK